MRVTTPDAVPEQRERLRAWLEAGHHAGMGWMADTAERRADPLALWPDARSVLVLGLNYGPEENPLATLAQRNRGSISVYARGRDYHEIVKGKLKELAGLLARRGGHDGNACRVKVFVDTAPLMEKPLAQAAGLGWQGKHTVLISRDLGNWLFLGLILTDAELPPDAAGADHCGTCRACLVACPTAAFPAPYQLDARRCISYLTIEHAGPIPRELRPLMGNRIFGCDDCLAVCPWNKFAEVGREAKLAAREELNAPPLADLARLDDAAFRAHFAASPIKRTGRDRFLRNVLIAIGNSGDASLAQDALRLMADPSPLVRGAAVWAASRLLPPGAFAAAAVARLAGETDLDVREEWAVALEATIEGDASLSPPAAAR